MTMIRRYKQTKIVATLGPASAKTDVMKKLFEKGVDLFRLNFSHGAHETHRQNAELIRAIEKEYNRPIGILADLQGPKLRIGHFKEERIELKKGQKFIFDGDAAEGDTSRVHLPHPEVIDALEVGHSILLDDGKVRVTIKEKEAGSLITEVETGKYLSNNKGFNVPDIILPIPALTAKDKEDMEAALDMGADWVALSFVQRVDDLYEAQSLLEGRAALMAKIEKPSALKDIDNIIEAADGIMVARGDLGVEIPPEKVPAVQKQIVRTARHKGTPVIVATQMLESMIENARPTRAEASDVATAVYDGADAVMLSAETAVGTYPEEAVSIMSRICEQTEHDETYRQIMDSDIPDSEDEASDSITAAAVMVADDIGAVAIVNYTSSGSTALRTAKQRPDIPILCLTQNKSTARCLTLSYGVRSFHVEDVNNFAETVDRAVGLVKENNYAQKDSKIVLTAGVPFGISGTTNVLRIADVK